MKLRQEEIETLPLNVVLEVLLAAALCMLGEDVNDFHFSRSPGKGCTAACSLMTLAYRVLLCGAFHNSNEAILNPLKHTHIIWLPCRKPQLSRGLQAYTRISKSGVSLGHL